MFNKRLLVLGLMAASTTLIVGCKEEAKQDDSAKLTTLEQKANYIIGQNIGRNLKNGGLAIEPESLALALADIRDGKDSRISEEEMQKIMQEVQEKAIAKQEEEQKKLSEENQTKGKAFLDENKAKEGVVATESGLQYKVITEGKGAKPKATDTVTVHYTGKLIDGTEFDSSAKHGQPATFPLDGVIPGWTEALQLMPQGSKWEIYIPSELAYGAGGQGPIPPSSTLIFEVELLEIKAPEAAAN
ncbi:FKBP-type peptidyl-prolyl cis-trans isomerase [Cellvibrio japonicus]|uniref:Peptidyl-prolyl cis-trans isomerase n=1 Tax=Cellvibrio japonicus (strain Ueda107) TaxID=498211 RepID=B3PGA6_CELJU|nr:FKBP-type peptidyl-prolyl cis-trans isomerase [Cellvibrio japonicus]ACE84616.1 macrophage infectivity potentiator [Cellvibrio japonicus Ueda107]